ncbi:MAG: DivIVA domain-containing protein [Solirubrobacteraceae bacterium]
MPDQSSAATEHAILQEITAPLETLPDDPLATIDADFQTTLRGYDRVAVDEYVQRTRRLVAEMQATRSPEAAVRRALERVGEQISGILQRAHETAEQITGQSRSEAEDRLEQARSEAHHIAAVAEQRVRDLDADTDRIWLERQRIVADAEDLAGQLVALAREAAERFPTDDEVAAAQAQAAPTDDEESSLLAGIPVEAGAPEDEPDHQLGTADPAHEDDEDDGDATRTVPFSPLAPDDNDDETAILGEDETAVLRDRDELPPDAKSPPPTPDDNADGPRPSRATEGSSVIRPASQAANRRLGQ